MKKSNDQKFSNSSELFQALFNNLTDALFIVDQTGKIIDANKPACALSGFEKADLLCKPVKLIIPNYREVKQKLAKSGEPLRATSELCTKKGDKIAVEVSCAPFTQGGDKFSIITAEDISERKIAETLRDIGTTLTASLDLGEVFDLLLVQLSRLIPYDGGNVMVPEGNIVRIARSRGYRALGENHSELVKTFQFEIDKTQNIRQIIETLKPLVVPDTQKSREWINTETSRNYKSWIGAPVVIDGKVNAIFSLDKVEADYFTESHASLLSVFSNQAALAIKNARLFSAETRRIQELDGLQATLSGISSELDLNALLEEIVERAIELLNATVGELGLYEPDIMKLRILVSKNFGQAYVGKLIDLGNGVMGMVAKTKEPLNIDNYLDFPEHLPEYESLGPRAGLAVPMMAGDELLGVLSVCDVQSDRKFDNDDIRLLNTFAQQATIAIQNARLFKDAKRRAEEAETLRRAGAAVTKTLNQNEAIKLILEQLAFVVPYDSASVLLFMQGKLKIVGGHGFKNIEPVLGMEFPLTRDNPGAVVYLDKKPLIINDIQARYPVSNQIPNSDEAVESWLGVPLIIQDRTIGILSLDAHQKFKFSQDHARLVTAFADQVSIALENARLYTDMVRSANQFETLYRLSQVISANIHSEEIYPAIHQAVSELMTTEFFSISLLDEEAKMIRDVYMMDRGIPQPLTSRSMDTGLFSQVLMDGKSRIYNTFDKSTMAETGAVMIGEIDEEEISQSILVVPLKIGPKKIGVLSAQSYQPYTYTESDLEMFELLAANVAIAIENAQLFSEVQNLAITDPLTKLFNRRKFYELAVQEFERSRRYNRPLCVIMMDLDHFKNVNDSYGHLVGDQVLEGLANLCKNSLRTIDILARYGGEEFVILLPETVAEEAMATAERLRQDAEAAPIHSNAGEISLTISLGVVTLDETCKNLEELLDRSDQALYVSKRTGRNRVSLWTPKFKPPPPGHSHT